MKGSYKISGRDRTVGMLGAISSGMAENQHIGTGAHDKDHRQARRDRKREERNVRYGKWSDED